MTAPDQDDIQRLERLHQQVIIVVGFLGAAAFAGLVLILGNPNFILNSPSEGGEGYLQDVAFILVFVSGMSGVTVMMSFLAMIWRLTNEGARRVYNVTLGLTMVVFIGFEIGLTFIFNAVNLGLALLSNTILSFTFLVVLMVIISARERE